MGSQDRGRYPKRDGTQSHAQAVAGRGIEEVSPAAAGRLTGPERWHPLRSFDKVSIIILYRGRGVRFFKSIKNEREHEVEKEIQDTVPEIVRKMLVDEMGINKISRSMIKIKKYFK